MALSTGQLIAEKERLQGVVDSAGAARSEVNKIDKALLALGVEIPGGPLRRAQGSSGGYACPAEGCAKSYAGTTSLRQHIEKKHPGVELQGDRCEEPGCDFIAMNGTGMAAHKRTKHAEVTAA